MSDVRRHVLAELLCRPGVLDLMDTYDGPVTAVRVREAAEVAGVDLLDELEAEVLVEEIVALRESGERIERSAGYGPPLSSLFPPSPKSDGSKRATRWTGGGE